MDQARMAVSAAGQAVEKVRGALEAMPAAYRVLMGEQLRALANALAAIQHAQSAILATVEGARHGE